MALWHNSIIAETGIWPYTDIITYKKLMFLHHLIHSEPGRICRQIVVIQQEKQLEATWYGELEEKNREMGISIKKEVIEKYKNQTGRNTSKKKQQRKLNKTSSSNIRAKRNYAS